jgi:hypothetical protein
MIETTTTFEGQVPREILLLAERMSKIHGEILVTRESGGIQLYFASPEALKRDGTIELSKRHGALNAEKHLGLGKYRNRVGTYNADAQCCKCMKYDVYYKVSDLFNMKPLAERGIAGGSSGVVTQVRERYLIPDGNGNMIPPHPGQVISLSKLPAIHPAIVYLKNRGYDISVLEGQMNACWCMLERPQSRVESVFYRKMTDEWRDTPQGRIVFFAYMYGVQVGWQARVLDYTVDLVEGGLQAHFYYHPYRNEWCLVRTRRNKLDAWEYKDEYKPYEENGRTIEFSPSKYKTATHAARNEMLMGFDAAIAANEAMQTSTAILVEGPLDAGRIGPPGIAVLGKSCSDHQAMLLGRHFKRVVYVADTDEAGKTSIPKFREKLSGRCEFSVVELPDGFKDLGEMTNEQAREFIEPYIE